jgi:hypothetical protein
MRETLLRYRGLLGPLAAVALFLAGMIWSPFEPHREPQNFDLPLEVEPTWTEEDWNVFSGKVRWAAEARLDTLPTGAAVGALARTFVGAPYVPHTLEVEGAEKLVVNFRGFDCVTLVENVLATVRFVRGGGAGRLADRGRAEAAYEALLREIRYRNGVVAGYPTRLHYFSDWIYDNERRGIVRDVTASLGGVPDPDRIDFMSTHPEAYRQLADSQVLEGIRSVEAAISSRPRHYVPQGSIATVADAIEEGDVIAATSSIPGLDVAHTGIAVRIDGALHLLHAPLVGESVEISDSPLAERIARISGQDGIVVARPVER